MTKSFFQLIKLGLLASTLLQSCATPQDPGKNFILIRPFQSKSLIRLNAKLQDEAEARDAAKGLEVMGETSLEPNTEPRIGVSLGYHSYSLSYSQAAPASAATVAEYGPTKAVDYQFHGAWDSLGFDVYWQEYRGFHDRGRNSQDGSTRYQYYPDLTLSRQGLNLFYINDAQNYKHNAQMHQSEFQKSSGDSLLFLSSVDSLRATHLPDDMEDRYQEVIEGHRLDALSFSLLAGYAFILKSPEGPWFAANIFGGRSYQLQESLENVLKGPHRFKAADKIITSASLGVDRAAWFFGLKFWADSLTVPLVRTDFILNTSSFELFLGCRL